MLRINPRLSVLAVDFQAKLMQAIDDAAAGVVTARRLVEAAKLSMSPRC